MSTTPTIAPKTNLPVKEGKPLSALETFRGMLEKNKGAIALALPQHLTVDRMMRLALTTVRTNPDLLTCDLNSVLASIVVASQLGLEIGVGGQAYLVPFNTTIKGKNGVPDKKVKMCQLIPGYRGLVNISRRSGDVDTFEAHVVYEHDTFDYEYGTKAFLTHKPNMTKARGKIIGAYALAQLKGSKPQFEVLSIVDLEKIRASAQSSNSPAYRDWEEEMYRKAPAKRLCKWLPFSVEMSRATDMDDRANAGIPMDIGEVIDIEKEPETIGADSKLGLGAATDALKARQAEVEKPAEPEKPRQVEQAERTPEQIEAAKVAAHEARQAAIENAEGPNGPSASAQIVDEAKGVTHRVLEGLDRIVLNENDKIIQMGSPTGNCEHGFDPEKCQKCAEAQAEEDAEREAIAQERPAKAAKPAAAEEDLSEDPTFKRMRDLAQGKKPKK